MHVRGNLVDDELTHIQRSRGRGTGGIADIDYQVAFENQKILHEVAVA